MALVIGVTVNSVIRVGKDTLRIDQIRGTVVRARLQAAHGEEEFVFEESFTQEILPTCFVSSARGKNEDGRIRLVFEAPKHITIKKA
jgi:hypothetical protein